MNAQPTATAATQAATAPALPAVHTAMLVRYAGISFISGAVNHGFFSTERSLWTALAGVAMFVAAAWWEHRAPGPAAPARDGLLRTLGWGALLSVGLGFFTGGLQHFPDSPGRSAWVVPLGFALSVLAFLQMDGRGLRRSGPGPVLVYGGLGTLAVGLASWAVAALLVANPQWLGVHAAAGHGHGAEPAAAGSPLSGTVVARRVEVRMDDAMRFVPATLELRAGEPVLLVVHNDGALPHEFVAGSPAALQAHAQEMRRAAEQGASTAHEHGHGGDGTVALSVAPGTHGEIVVTAREAGTYGIACLVPGHYEAGMRGTLTVLSAQAAAAEAQAPGPAAPAAGHRH
jgi:uncharacterized cupredoxin-like copper-binding protein